MDRGENHRQSEKAVSGDVLEHVWDQKLHIETAQETDEIPHAVNFRYEPTPYSVLERLAESGYINGDCFLLDYGCGKGRCPIFLHAMKGCRAVGIDYDPVMIGCAKANLAKSETTGIPARRIPEKGAVSFRRVKAQNYAVKNENTFYFFNPFSDVILETVLHNILSSWYENPRRMRSGRFCRYSFRFRISCRLPKNGLLLPCRYGNTDSVRGRT